MRARDEGNKFLFTSLAANATNKTGLTLTEFQYGKILQSTILPTY